MQRGNHLKRRPSCPRSGQDPRQPCHSSALRPLLHVPNSVPKCVRVACQHCVPNRLAHSFPARTPNTQTVANCCKLLQTVAGPANCRKLLQTVANCCGLGVGAATNSCKLLQTVANGLAHSLAHDMAHTFACHCVLNGACHGYVPACQMMHADMWSCLAQWHAFILAQCTSKNVSSLCVSMPGRRPKVLARRSDCSIPGRHFQACTVA